MERGFILTEKGRNALGEKKVSEAMGRLLEEIDKHPGKVFWSLIPAMSALQSKALRLGFVRLRR